MNALGKRVAETLRSPAVGKIGFKTPRLFVVPYEYWAVAEAIETDRINVGVYKMRDSTHDAEYQHDGSSSTPRVALKNDTVGLGANAVEGKSTFVHEATHAIFDIFMGGKSIPNLENEFAAYLAQLSFIWALCAAGDQQASRFFSATKISPLRPALEPLAKQVVQCPTYLIIPATEMEKAKAVLGQGYQNVDAPMFGLPPVSTAPPMVPDTP